jgi:Ca2+-binding RTX toxin-like protein
MESAHSTKVAGLVALILLVGVSTAASAARSAESPAAPVPGLADAIDKQILDPEVVTALQENGAVEAFLILREVGDERADEREQRMTSVLARIGEGATLVRDYEALRIALLEFRSTETLLRAVNDQEVVGLGADTLLRPLITQSLPFIGQPQVASWGLTGEGTSVAVLDSGVDYVTAPFSCPSASWPANCPVVAARDFGIDDGFRDDSSFHGTGVAMAVFGTAPSAKILALDIYDGYQQQSASTQSVVSGINWVVANQARFNIRAMNLSAGDGTHHLAACSAASNPYVAAFRDARAVGVIPVVAAGNDAFVNGMFREGVAYPACTPGAIRVGAVYRAAVGSKTQLGCTDATTAPGQVTCWSQTGSLLSVLAPGNEVWARGKVTGTSIAAPFVAGAAAILASSDPSATRTEIESAIVTGPLVYDPRNGITRPRLDLPSAVRALSACPNATIVGTNGDDVLIGGPGDDIIDGRDGRDHIHGGGGNDRICGGGGNDEIYGENGRDFVLGGGGDDVLNGYADRCFPPYVACLMPESDVLIGGPGVDTADYSGHAVPVNVELDGRDLPEDGAYGEGDTVSQIENVTGGLEGDTLTGNWGPNVLNGGPGNDTLRDGDRSCNPPPLTLCAVNSSDALIGGQHEDRADYSNRTSDLTLTLDAYANDGESGETDQLQVENVTGGRGNDTLIGDKGWNKLDGGLGEDTLTGRSAPDLLDCGADVDWVDPDALDTVLNCELLVGGITYP